MQDKKFQFRGYLITGLVITFLLTFILLRCVANSDAREEYLVTHSSVQHESEDHKLKQYQTIPSLVSQPDLILAGTIMVGREQAYALIMEETTGRQNLYSVGESIKGAEILRIDKDSVVIEKDGKSHILRITGGNDTVNTPSEILTVSGSPTVGVQEELPYFEPVFSVTGPPVDENAPVEELPRFEPITNSTGPPVNSEVFFKDLPKSEPFESDSGPSGM